jgi:copper(I)-binding protein
MLMGLAEPLREGDRFPLTLSFEKAGETTVQVAVLKAGASGPAHGSHSTH